MTKAELIAVLADLPSDAEVLLCRHGVPIARIAEIEVLVGHDENLIESVSDDGDVVYAEPYAVIWADTQDAADVASAA